MKNKSKNINIFLIDGEVTGRIKCTMANWTGVIYKIPRSMLSDVKDREDLKQSGIYFLIGKDEQTDKDVVYVGQSGVRKNGEGTLNRVIEHTRNQKSDYFNDVIILTTQNDSFGQTEISYLENKFTNYIREVDRFEVKNSNEPSIGNVSEEKQSELDEVIHNAKILIGTLGYKFLIPLKNKEDKVYESKNSLLYLSRLSNRSSTIIEAKAERTSEGYVVLAGSMFEHIDSNAMPLGVKKLRDEYSKDGTVVDGLVTKDILFSSPSYAAGFILGVSTNGKIVWKNSEGLTLNELEKRELSD